MESLLISFVVGGFGASLAQAFIAYALERAYSRSKPVLICLMVVPAIIASIYSIIFLADPLNHQPWVIIIVSMTSLLLWAVFFHIAAFNFGRYIGNLKLGRWSNVSKNWVKSINYIYLSLSTFSILKVVVSAVTNEHGLTYFNAFAAVILGFAVALRITRTSIEIFEWDKLQPV